MEPTIGRDPHHESWWFTWRATLLGPSHPPHHDLYHGPWSPPRVVVGLYEGVRLGKILVLSRDVWIFSLISNFIFGSNYTLFTILANLKSLTHTVILKSQIHFLKTLLWLSSIPSRKFFEGQVNSSEVQSIFFLSLSSRYAGLHP